MFLDEIREKGLKGADSHLSYSSLAEGTQTHIDKCFYYAEMEEVVLLEFWWG